MVLTEQRLKKRQEKGNRDRNKKKSKRTEMKDKQGKSSRVRTIQMSPPQREPGPGEHPFVDRPGERKKQEKKQGEKIRKKKEDRPSKETQEGAGLEKKEKRAGH